MIGGATAGGWAAGLLVRFRNRVSMRRCCWCGRASWCSLVCSVVATVAPPRWKLVVCAAIYRGSAGCDTPGLARVLPPSGAVLQQLFACRFSRLTAYDNIASLNEGKTRPPRSFFAITQKINKAIDVELCAFHDSFVVHNHMSLQ